MPRIGQFVGNTEYVIMVQETWGNSQDRNLHKTNLRKIVGCPNPNVVPQKIGYGMMEMGM